MERNFHYIGGIFISSSDTCTYLVSVVSTVYVYTLSMLLLEWVAEEFLDVLKLTSLFPLIIKRRYTYEIT